MVEPYGMWGEVMRDEGGPVGREKWYTALCVMLRSLDFFPFEWVDSTEGDSMHNSGSGEENENLFLSFCAMLLKVNFVYKCHVIN